MKHVLFFLFTTTLYAVDMPNSFLSGLVIRDCTEGKGIQKKVHQELKEGLIKWGAVFSNEYGTTFTLKVTPRRNWWGRTIDVSADVTLGDLGLSQTVTAQELKNHSFERGPIAKRYALHLANHLANAIYVARPESRLAKKP